MADDKDWNDYFGTTYNVTRPKEPGNFDRHPFSDLADGNFSDYDNTSIPKFSDLPPTNDFCANFSHVYLNVTCEFAINYAEPMYG